MFISASGFRQIYFKLCRAGLQSEMAQRILYSILPSLADSFQVASTEGVVDSKALRAAVSGRKNIIKYGIKAVGKELENYMPRLNPGISYLRTYGHYNRLVDMGKVEEALDLAISMFQDEWMHSYGGRPWEQIARTVRQIYRLDKTLDALRETPKTADREIQEISIMRNLIVEMNVFDGLAHNSASILENLSDLEIDEAGDRIPPVERSQRKRQNYNDLYRLMNAKELENPIEVYKQIEQTLKDSGDINKFKDWTSKIRNTKEFFEDDPSTVRKLFFIYLRKALLFSRSLINKGRDEAAKYIRQLETSWDVGKFANIENEFEAIREELNIFLEQIDSGEFEKEFLKTNGGLKNAESIHKILFSLKKPLHKLFVDYHTHQGELDQIDASQSSRPTPELKEKMITLLKAKLSIANQLSYILDSI